MKPGSLLIGLGVAGAAWYLYNYNPITGAGATTADGKTPVQSNGVPAAGTHTSAGTNNPPATPPPAPPATPPPPAAPSISFAQYIANTIGGREHMFSADVWNWHYGNYSGVEQTTDLFDPAGDRGAPISVVTYLARRATAGLSGLAGVGPTGLTATLPSHFRSAGAYIARGRR